MRIRLQYTERLATDLFVSLPVETKRVFISHAQSALDFPTFIETGTARGDTALFASRLFQAVHTIELSPRLADRALSRFSEVPNVQVHPGDSGSALSAVLSGIDTSCLFWLDAHYSGDGTARGETDTPIAAELEAIARHHVRPHAVLIDDARVFGADDAYPALDEVFVSLRGIDPSFRIGICSDIIWAARTKLLDFRWHTLPSGAVVPPTTAPDRRRPG